MTSDVPWFDGMLINATFNDYRDGEDFQLECARFLEAIKDHTEVNTLASGWEELSRPPVWMDYREVLMHWAHGMGWVVEGGPYDHMYAQDVRVLFGENGAPLPEALLPYVRGWVGGPNGMSVSSLAHALGMRAWWEQERQVAGPEYRRVDANGRVWRQVNRAEAAHLAATIPRTHRLIRQDYTPRGYHAEHFPDEVPAAEDTGNSDDEMHGGQAFNQGRHLTAALPASGTVRALHTRTQRQVRSRLSSPQPDPTEHAEEDLDGLSPRTRSMTELVASTPAAQMPPNYTGGRGPPAAQPAGASDQRDADGAAEHGWAGEPMPQDLGAAQELIRRQDRERARLENQLRDYEARRRWATQAPQAGEAAPRDRGAYASHGAVTPAATPVAQDTRPMTLAAVRAISAECRVRGGPSILDSLTPAQLTWASRLIRAMSQIPDMHDGWQRGTVRPEAGGRGAGAISCALPSPTHSPMHPIPCFPLSPLRFPPSPSIPGLFPLFPPHSVARSDQRQKGEGQELFRVPSQAPLHSPMHPIPCFPLSPLRFPPCPYEPCLFPLFPPHSVARSDQRQEGEGQELFRVPSQAPPHSPMHPIPCFPLSPLRFPPCPYEPCLFPLFPPLSVARSDQRQEGEGQELFRVPSQAPPHSPMHPIPCFPLSPLRFPPSPSIPGLFPLFPPHSVARSDQRQEGEGQELFRVPSQAPPHSPMHPIPCSPLSPLRFPPCPYEPYLLPLYSPHSVARPTSLPPSRLYPSQGVAADVIAIVVYGTPSRRMSMWPDEDSVELAILKSIHLCADDARVMVHMTLRNDPVRRRFLTDKLAKCRANVLDQARTWTFLWFGLPFKIPKQSRAHKPHVHAVDKITFKDFRDRYPADESSHGNLTWTREPHDGGLLFSHPAFETGLHKSLFKGKPMPVVVKLYHVAYYLAGVEHRIINEGEDLENSAGPNIALVATSLRKVTAWCKAAIMAPSVNGSGPWYVASEKAWAFSRNETILISTDGIEETEGINRAPQAVNEPVA
ncbi:unnamed protein product [Closterium sp. NIES-64]|nr:unnamed protein product [Closterium sp. NIES-64]